MLQGQNLKRITGLAFAPDGSRVYTTSEGAAEVLEWDLKVWVMGAINRMHRRLIRDGLVGSGYLI